MSSLTEDLIERVPVRKPTEFGSVYYKTQRLVLHVLPNKGSKLWNKTIPEIRHTVRQFFKSFGHNIVETEVTIFKATSDDANIMLDTTRKFKNMDEEDSDKEMVEDTDEEMEEEKEANDDRLLTTSVPTKSGKDEVSDSSSDDIDIDDLEEKARDISWDLGCEDRREPNDFMVTNNHQIRIYATFGDIDQAAEAKKTANIDGVLKEYGWRVFGHPKNARVLKCGVGFRSHVVPQVLSQLDPKKVNGPLKLKVGKHAFF